MKNNYYFHLSLSMPRYLFYVAAIEEERTLSQPLTGFVVLGFLSSFTFSFPIHSLFLSGLNVANVTIPAQQVQSKWLLNV